MKNAPIVNIPNAIILFDNKLRTPVRIPSLSSKKTLNFLISSFVSNNLFNYTSTSSN